MSQRSSASGPAAGPPRLLSLVTGVPAHVLRQSDVAAAASRLFEHDFGDFSRMAQVYDSAAIDERRSSVPLDWYLKPHGFGERNAIYLESSLALLEDAARRALDAAGLRAEQIDAIVTVSSSGIATPSLDARLMNRLPFRADTVRLPLFGLGCAGGVLGLARAGDLARALPGSRVLLLVVELCGLTFRHADRSKSNVVATALFGDGAAAAVLSCTDAPGPALAAAGEHTWPETLDVMGWQVEDDGLRVRFSRDIPLLVRTRMAGPLAAFLDRHGLVPGDFDRFLCHPGGAKVLDALEEVFGLPPGGLVESRTVLAAHGNMSAATVLFVLRRLLDDPVDAGRRRCLLSSLGPGFTAAFAVLEEA